MSKLNRIITAVVVSELIGIAATPFTLAAIPVWYQSLNKPFLSPPNWIFGPVWTVLYALMGIAAGLIWQKGLKNKKVKKALIYFIMQLFFNFLWSLIFFGMRLPVLALIDILVLFAYIVITMLEFQRVSKPAAYLMIPYLFWVVFATYLNFSIVMFNR